MKKEFKIRGEELRHLWGYGKPITVKGKKYSVGRMSYGDYFFEPLGKERGETKGFALGTLWLEKSEPYEKDIYVFNDLLNESLRIEEGNNPHPEKEGNPHFEEAEQKFTFELGTFKEEEKEIKRRIFINWKIEHKEKKSTTVNGEIVSDYYILGISGDIKKGKIFENSGQIDYTISEIHRRNKLKLSIPEEDYYRLMDCWNRFHLNDLINNWDEWLLLPLPKWVFDVGKKLKKYEKS